MTDILVFAAIFAGWFILVKFVLPRFGVST